MVGLKFMLGLLLMYSSFAGVAQTDEDDLGLGMGDEGMNVHIDKAQVSQMLDLMQSQGQISAEDAAKARLELNQKSDADMQNLQKSAMERINSGNIPTLPPPTANTTHAPASLPSAATPPSASASAVSPGAEAAPVASTVPKAQAPLAAQPADDRSKKLQDAFKFINQ
ncbi:MAG: hypothetical protein HYV97_08645 [Bdellovibrio sp.]|nr:hypothetical protein [Bdellovibrio sp.]